ncbi:MAG TPA: hypothetical protein VLL08_07250 [Kineosporiaceae bacterium]|nr:hypothetical protein [Kineosporiaceae bacterium]
MDTMTLSQWIIAATFIVAVALVAISLARLIRSDGYHTRPAPDPRSDWGTPTLPSLPYSSRF